MLTLGFI